MQTLTGSSSQHSYFGGTTSCTSSASLFARYILDKIPRKKGVDKICEAGANLWLRWKKEEDIPHSNFQTWIDVQKTYPQLFKDTKLIHETNGFMGNEPQEKNDFLLSSFGQCLQILSEGTRSAVLTSNNSSYGFGFRPNKFYFFDSHGCEETNQNAYLIRLDSMDELKNFILEHFEPKQEFSMAIFEKVSEEKGDVQG